MGTTLLYSAHKLIYSRAERATLSTRGRPKGGPSARAGYATIRVIATTQATVQDITTDKEDSEHRYGRKVRKPRLKVIYNNSQRF